MKRTSLTLLAALFILLPGRSGKAELVDRVAAVVNADIITFSEVEKRAAPELSLLANAAAKDKAAERNRILREALDQLVADKLMDWQLKEQHVDVTDQEVDSAAENLKTQNGLDDKKLEQALKEQGMTV
ncbi:MAG TPA: SurA N-terminal domain-containing protein, partial [Myxococcaceae bacterium]|nr:SurA N-terminal domain-containing protein [Myxococcaceae bacterium]